MERQIVASQLERCRLGAESPSIASTRYTSIFKFQIVSYFFQINLYFFSAAWIMKIFQSINTTFSIISWPFSCQLPGNHGFSSVVGNACDRLELSLAVLSVICSRSLTKPYSSPCFKWKHSSGRKKHELHSFWIAIFGNHSSIENRFIGWAAVLKLPYALILEVSPPTIILHLCFVAFGFVENTHTTMHTIDLGHLKSVSFCS